MADDTNFYYVMTVLDQHTSKSLLDMLKKNQPTTNIKASRIASQILLAYPAMKRLQEFETWEDLVTESPQSSWMK